MATIIVAQMDEVMLGRNVSLSLCCEKLQEF
jgi:hypothetical protein